MRHNTLRKMLAVAAVLTAAVAANAQSFMTEDYSGAADDNASLYNIVITNNWQDNWFFGAGAGINSVFSSIGTPKLAFGTNLFTLKWFSPQIALRIGYQGLNLREGLEDGYYVGNHSYYQSWNSETKTLAMGYFNLYSHVLINVSNAILGYKDKRFFNISPYAGASYVKLYDNSEGQGFNSARRDREIALDFGVYSTFRLSERLVAYADLGFTNFSGRYHDASSGGRATAMSLSGGLAYNLYKTNWTPAHGVQVGYAAAKRVAEEAQLAAEEAEKKAAVAEQKTVEAEKQIVYLIDSVEVLLHTIDTVREYMQVPVSEYDSRIANADMVIYFKINRSTLSITEAAHLERYVNLIREIDPDHVYYITGCADKNTGTPEINLQLSDARANRIRSILMEQYGIPEDHIVIKATLVSDKNAEGELDRCVLLEKE